MDAVKKNYFNFAGKQEVIAINVKRVKPTHLVDDPNFGISGGFVPSVKERVVAKSKVITSPAAITYEGSIDDKDVHYTTVLFYKILIDSAFVVVNFGVIPSMLKDHLAGVLRTVVTFRTGYY
ncbi:hypothetical protein DGG96_07370 [Legionella qingyii]|uniref:Uncharacterized protein n=1 Tax=Legionella qingyii TaxID=2184757 RepID=A0A317U633_9GAMM|nr:hypothetical protein DGG96_07370 [Legionella qingyii]